MAAYTYEVVVCEETEDGDGEHMHAPFQGLSFRAAVEAWARETERIGERVLWIELRREE